MLSRAVLDALEASRAASDADSLATVIGGFLAQHGFEHFTSALVVPGAGGVGPEVTWLENVAPDWFAHYQEAGLSEHDYAMRRIAAEGATSPFLIGQGHALKDLTVEERAMYASASEAGLNSGIAFPIPTIVAGVDVSSGFALWTGEDAEAARACTAQHGAEIATFLLGVHSQVLSALAPRAFRASLLSGRERECLCWLASGLRPEAIASRLGIATVTVHRHLRAARDKLGATTLPAAVAKAMTAGVIEP